MRKFWLESATGGQLGLNGESGVWLTNPSGLGVTLNPEFADLGQGFFACVSGDYEPQTTAAADLVLRGASPYRIYQTVVDWIARAGSLELIYSPYAGEEFRRRVMLSYLTKTELAGPVWMTVPVALACLTPWYKAVASELELTALGDTVMRCDTGRLDVAMLAASLWPGMAAEVSPGGHIAAAFELTYTGQITNPVIELVGEISGKTHGRCALSVTLDDGEALILSTRYADSSISRRNAAGVLTDVLDKADLATDPFPRAPVGEACTLRISADGVITGRASVKVYYYFKGV